jgi:hypothetical protein
MSTVAAKLSSRRAIAFDGDAARKAQRTRPDASDRPPLPPAAGQAEWTERKAEREEPARERRRVGTWNGVNARAEPALFALILGAIACLWLATALVP